MHESTILKKVFDQRREKEAAIDEKLHKLIFEKNFPIIWQFTDLDLRFNFWLLVLLRLLQSIFLTSSMCHPDEYW